MSRVEDIIVRARDTLADPDGDRWSDARLLRLVNDAQDDIALQSRILRSKAVIPLVTGQAEYSLPDNCFIVTRCLFDDSVIPFKSHIDMDYLARQTDKFELRATRRDTPNSVREAWELETGSQVDFAIYDKQDRKKIKFYPIPNGTGGDSYTFTNEGSTSDTIPQSEIDAYNLLIGAGYTLDASDLGSIAVSSDVVGVVVSVEDYQMSSVYGVVVDIEADDITNETFSSPYGVVTAISETDGTVLVYYIRKPIVLTSVTDSLELDDAWDRAIRYYVTGMALKDDKDTQNRQFAAEELQLYKRELDLAKETSQIDSTDGSQYEVPYISGV